MLAVAGLLVALRVGQGVPTVQPNGCDIPQYTTRFTLGVATECCNTTDVAGYISTHVSSQCYNGDLCEVATGTFRCCYNFQCVNIPKTECPAVQWCSDTGPQGRVSPAEPADLDGATVGTIVVASLIGVALVGGAIAVHSGVAGV